MGAGNTVFMGPPSSCLFSTCAEDDSCVSPQGRVKSEGMRTALSIGDFSRITHLSVKTLRRYHDSGLLEPAEVDPFTGYRYYTTSQVPTAQVIRRFRDLGMPVKEVAEVLATADPSARSSLIAVHLRRLESQLELTREA